MSCIGRVRISGAENVSSPPAVTLMSCARSGAAGFDRWNATGRSSFTSAREWTFEQFHHEERDRLAGGPRGVAVTATSTSYLPSFA